MQITKTNKKEEKFKQVETFYYLHDPISTRLFVRENFFKNYFLIFHFFGYGLFSLVIEKFVFFCIFLTLVLYLSDILKQNVLFLEL